MRIGVLSNLRSGRNARNVGRVLELLGRHPAVAHVETSSVGVVPEALAELRREGLDLLVVNGGDGTLQHALTVLLGEADPEVPLIAALPGGRTNTSACDLGTRRDPVRALASVLDAACTGRVQERTVSRPVLRVEFDHGLGREVRYGMFFGAGVVVRGIEFVKRTLPHHHQGVLGASLVTGGLLARLALRGDSSGLLAPEKIQLRADGCSLDRGATRLLLATSLERLFLGLRPFWGRGPGRVRFTCVAADAERTARALPGILIGRPGRLVTEANGFTSRNARELLLRLDSGFTVDGELLPPQAERVISIRADTRVRFVRAR